MFGRYYITKLLVAAFTIAAACLFALPSSALAQDSAHAYALLDEEAELVFFNSPLEIDVESGGVQTVEDEEGLSHTGVVYALSADGYSMTGWNSTPPWSQEVRKAHVAGTQSVQIPSAKGLFAGAELLEEADLTGLDTSGLEDMSEMFCGCCSLTSATLPFSTAGVKDMSAMFFGCSALKVLDMSSFDVGNVTDMSEMFCDCASIRQLSLSSFATPSLTDSERMFKGCAFLSTLDISGFDTMRENVDMYSMFQGCSHLEEVKLGERFAFSPDMPDESFHAMLSARSSRLPDIPCNATYTGKWSNVAAGLSFTSTDLAEQYDGSTMAGTWTREKNLVLPVGKAYAVLTKDGTLVFFRSEFEYEPVGDFDQIVSDIAGNVYTGILFSDVEDFSISYDEFCDYAFDGCLPPWHDYASQITSVEVASGQQIEPANLTCFFRGLSAMTACDTSGISAKYADSTCGMFMECKALDDLTLSLSDASGICYTVGMFDNCAALETVDLASFSQSRLFDMSAMFYKCPSLETVSLSDIDTSGVVSMASMLCGCSSLASFDAGVLDVSSVGDFSGMFANCASLSLLPAFKTTTSSATSMAGMFSGCSSLTSIGLSSFDARNVSDMSNMFQNCANLASLDLSSFDTGNAVDMSEMFSGCRALSSLDVSSFEVGNVKNMYQMFSECSSLAKLDLSSFATEPDVFGQDEFDALGSYGMFSGCSSLTELDISSMDTSGVPDQSSMFAGCFNLAKVELGPTFSFSGSSSSGEATETIYALLPAPPSSSPHTGKWVRTAATATASNGPFTSQELAQAYSQDSAGTWEWERCFSVSYKPNGGQGNMEDSIVSNVLGCSVQVEPCAFTAPSRKEFAEWNTLADGIGESFAPGVSLSGITGNKTLYAIWKALPITFTVAYSAPGASNVPAAQTKTEGVPLTLDGVVPLRDAQEVGGYKIAVELDGGTLPGGCAIPESCAITRTYAFDKWESSSDGRAYSPGGKYATDADSVMSAVWSETDVVDGFALPSPKRGGRVFGGWLERTAAGERPIPQSEYGSFIPHADTVLVATWKEPPVEHRIYFEPEGASGSMEAFSFSSDGDFPNLPPCGFSYPGHRFLGWGIEPGGSPLYPDCVDVGFIEFEDAELTLYAIWEMGTYSITWENFDGTVLQADELSYGAMPSYRGQTPQRPSDYIYDYRFSGWAPVIGTVRDDVCYTAAFASSKRRPFADVDDATYHADDILWTEFEGISRGWENGNLREFRPYSNVARADMAAFLFRLAENWKLVDGSWTANGSQRQAFADVSEATPHAREIWWLADAGISSGWADMDGTKTFRPYEPVARQDMAAFLFRLAKLAGKGDAAAWTASNESKTMFSDVSGEDADNHHDEVWWLADKGISRGWKDSSGKCEFRGLWNVARCDMAAFLHRMGDL